MRGTSTDAPFIITAELPADLARWATSLRNAHFPPERNFLRAHVTLFHSLPPSSAREVKTALANAAREFSPVSARLERVMPLGQGTALGISSPDMIALWEELAHRFHGLITPQDTHPPRLHITIQNKVTPAEAKSLQAEMVVQFEPSFFNFTGLSLHIYRGGPWEFARTYSFRG